MNVNEAINRISIRLCISGLSDEERQAWLVIRAHVERKVDDAMVERAAFESWLQGTSGWKACAKRNQPMRLRQNGDGSYNDFRVNDRWFAWLASARYERMKFASKNTPGTNSGHGHVWERPDGIKARCGGPGICKECLDDRSLIAALGVEGPLDGINDHRGNPESPPCT